MDKIKVIFYSHAKEFGDTRKVLLFFKAIFLFNSFKLESKNSSSLFVNCRVFSSSHFLLQLLLVHMLFNLLEEVVLGRLIESKNREILMLNKNVEIQ